VSSQREHSGAGQRAPLSGAGMSSRVAVVTGAASGQGAEAARLLAADGFAVGLVDLDEARLDETLSSIVAGGGRAVCLPADVSDRGQVEVALAELEGRFGSPWLVAAAAGVLEGGFTLEAPEEHWRRVTEVNYLGVVNIDAVAGRAMVAAGRGGRIVNWSAACVVYSGLGYPAYNASKAALESFSRSLAIELAPERITVNVIRPGSIRTPMLQAFDERSAAEVERNIPLGRWGTPRDVASAMRFLASDEAEWITGAVLAVDGGDVAAAGGAPRKAVEERLARERRAARGAAEAPSRP
jgi:NAD(P)-dependent dehydrogenase (short-subunit alcohol dehydrogenase family)